MKLVSLNCKSYNSAKKDIQNIVDIYNFDIWCLSETTEAEKEKNNLKIVQDLNQENQIIMGEWQLYYVSLRRISFHRELQSMTQRMLKHFLFTLDQISYKVFC